jgi:hypothetical protein
MIYLGFLILACYISYKIGYEFGETDQLRKFSEGEYYVQKGR